MEKITVGRLRGILFLTGLKWHEWNRMLVNLDFGSKGNEKVPAQAEVEGRNRAYS